MNGTMIFVTGFCHLSPFLTLNSYARPLTVCLMRHAQKCHKNEWAYCHLYIIPERYTIFTGGSVIYDIEEKQEVTLATQTECPRDGHNPPPPPRLGLHTRVCTSLVGTRYINPTPPAGLHILPLNEPCNYV